MNSCDIFFSKDKRVSSILLITTDHNIWIIQILLAVGLFKVEIEFQQYQTILNQKGEISTNFQPIPSQECKDQFVINTVKENDGEGEEKKEETTPF